MQSVLCETCGKELGEGKLSAGEKRCAPCAHIRMSSLQSTSDSKANAEETVPVPPIRVNMLCLALQSLTHALLTKVQG